MKLLALAFVIPALLLCPHGARAQAVAVVVSDCSAVTMLTGPQQPLVEDVTGKLCGMGGTAGSITTVKPDSSISTGYQQLTSLSASTTWTPPALTTYCIITAEAAALRFRTDGTAPTATVGFPMAIGQPFTFRMSIASLSAVALIQQAAGGIANISCFKDS